ncbi:MAG: hypothetical protein D6706_21055 [Chloroflexi bacterium]|nr:MAG: hypothetical protein D6706_21055 [Chloroflexota bacterium]
MLKFAKSTPYIPDPARSRPLVTDMDKARAAETPPHPVPFHCKPWVDGQTAGWTLFYGYLTPVTIVGEENGRITVKNLDQLAAETGQPRVIDQFAAGHFGIGSGYTLRTPEGFVSLILPPTHPPNGLETVIGIIETDWYPRQLFLVFRVPPPGTQISLDYQAELARVVIIPRQEQLTAQPMTETELETLRAQEAAYLAEEQETPTRWTAASGDSFTHLYKIWSGRHRQKNNKEGNEPTDV